MTQDRRTAYLRVPMSSGSFPMTVGLSAFFEGPGLYVDVEVRHITFAAPVSGFVVALAPAAARKSSGMRARLAAARPLGREPGRHPQRAWSLSGKVQALAGGAVAAGTGGRALPQ